MTCGRCFAGLGDPRSFRLEAFGEACLCLWCLWSGRGAPGAQIELFELPVRAGLHLGGVRGADGPEGSNGGLWQPVATCCGPLEEDKLPSAWLPSCISAWLPGCLAAWLPVGTVATCGRLWQRAVAPLKKISCLAAWLPGCLAVCLPGCLPACLPACRAVLCLGRLGGMTTEKAWGVGNSSETQLQCN